MKVLPRVLFLLKYRHSYTYGDYSVGLASGLFNSATYVSQMLKHRHYDSHVVEVIDNNAIDREVAKHNPDVVILEALWCVPEKLEVLKKLHPNVKWVIRLHSEIPFLANERIAIDWINHYLKYENVYVGFNSHNTLEEMKNYFKAMPIRHEHRLIYLPNYYPVGNAPIVPKSIVDNTIHIGLFGALRPLKGQLLQAFSAIEYARRNRFKLKLYINATRKDGAYMEPILDNLRALFDNLDSNYELVEVDWLDRHDFLKLMRKMNVSLSVSLSETFCLVAADAVSEGVPVVVSDEVSWVPKEFQADVNSVESIVKTIGKTINNHKKWFPLNTRHHLEKQVKENAEVWEHELFHLVTL
jgi:hypothetical protein